MNAEFVELTSELKLDQQMETEPAPMTTDDNDQENNQNVNNAIPDIPGQQFKTSTVAGRLKQSTKPTTSSHRAYEVAEFYRERKQFQLNKIKAEEERLRQYKAKPMPNFRAIHSKAITASKALGDCVSPATPEVLRRGIAMKEKQKQKIKEHELKLAERPPIVAKSTKVLKEKPFKPILEPHRPLKVEPFKLQMDERLEQRRMYDENYQREVAIKKQKEQEKKNQEEAKQRQLARDNTVFTARANPFKKT